MSLLSSYVRRSLTDSLRMVYRPHRARMHLRAGEADPRDQPGAGPHRLGYEGGVHVGELQLGTADEPERAVGADVAPGDGQMAVGAVAAHEGAAEIQAVIPTPDRDRNLPPGGGSVAGHGLGRLPRVPGRDQARPVLAGAAQRQVNVLEARCIGPSGDGAAGQVTALDHDRQRRGLGPGPRRGAAPRRWRRGVLLV